MERFYWLVACEEWILAAYGNIAIPELLRQGMVVAEMNQKLIANNIANVDTPNYNPAEMDIQATLRRAVDGRLRFSLRKTDSRHLDSTHFRPDLERLAPLSKNDYNKVDLDYEMVKLSDNTSKYTTYSGLLRKHFGLVKGMLSNLR